MLTLRQPTATIVKTGAAPQPGHYERPSLKDEYPEKEPDQKPEVKLREQMEGANHIMGTWSSENTPTTPPSP